MKKVLFVSSESVPFIKTGGLADVVGSLPKYFDKNKYDVRVMLPNACAYPSIYRTPDGHGYNSRPHSFLRCTPPYRR